MLDEAMEDKAVCEVSGMDGTPIRNPRTRNRVNRPTQYLVAVDNENVELNDWTSRFVMRNTGLTGSPVEQKRADGVNTRSEELAFKTTDAAQLKQFVAQVIRKYPRSNVIVCHNNYSHAPMRGQDCKRFGVDDIYEPLYGGWRNGGGIFGRSLAAESEKVDEAAINLADKDGTIANVIREQVIDSGDLNKCATKQQVYDLVAKKLADNGIDTPASRRLLFKIQRSYNLVSAMQAVTNSYLSGANLGVDGPRRSRRGVYEKEAIDERRMDGPAAAACGGRDEVAEFKQMLEDGIVEFQFRKADGSLRRAVGTRSEAVVPTSEREKLDPTYDDSMKSYESKASYIIWFWDLEKSQVRCFNTNRFEGLINFEETSARLSPTATGVGKIKLDRAVVPVAKPVVGRYMNVSGPISLKA